MTRAGLQALVGRAFADGWMEGHAYGRDEPTMSDAAQALTIAEETDAVVEFVARWLLRPGSCVPWLAKEWQADMGA